MADRSVPAVPDGRVHRVRWFTPPDRPVEGGTVFRKPVIVSICGSMRFFPQMLEVAAEETAKGHIVLAPFSVVAPQDQGGDFKAMLDELHRRKIDMADRVIVVTDQHGYVGTSTRAEMVYAEQLGMMWDVRGFELPEPTPDRHRAARASTCRGEGDSDGEGSAGETEGRGLTSSAVPRPTDGPGTSARQPSPHPSVGDTRLRAQLGEMAQEVEALTADLMSAHAELAILRAAHAGAQ